MFDLDQTSNAILPRRIFVDKNLRAKEKRKVKMGFASRFCPSHGPLRFVTSNSRVTRVSRSPLCEKRSA